MNRFRFILLLLFLTILLHSLSAENDALSAGDFVLDKIVVDFDGVGSPRSARNALDLRNGELVTASDLTAALSRLESDGRYSSVSHELKPGKRERQELHVHIIVNPGFKPSAGKAVYIDSIEITGNWKTHRRIFLSEFTFGEGDAVRLEDIEESVQRVFNRDLFFEIDWGLYEDGRQTVMELRVREKWTLFPVIYVIGDDGQTRLMLGVVELNAWGRGFMLLGNYIAIYSSEAQTRHNFEMIYRHPRISGTPFLIDAAAGYMTNSNYISDESGRVDAYLYDSAYGDAALAYEWMDNLFSSLLITWSHDVYNNEEAANAGYGGYDETWDILSLGLGMDYGGVNLRDVRRSGFGGGVDFLSRIPFEDSEQPFIQMSARAEFHEVFLRDWLNLSSRIMIQYSDSDFIPYQADMEDFLRGGSAREYHSPLVFGTNLEIGLAPLRKKWMYLEVLGFIDLAWGGEDFPDAAGSKLRFRAGPGLRLTVPPIAGTTLSLDFAFTEEGERELFFGMVRFF